MVSDLKEELGLRYGGRGAVKMIIEGDQGCKRRKHVVILNKIFLICPQRGDIWINCYWNLAGQRKRDLGKIIQGSCKCKNTAV